MTSSDLAIQAEDLYFYYLTPQKQRLFSKLPFKTIVFEKKVALNHVSLTVAPGKITALMGKNGSGKTSLIKIITGARFAQGGNVKVFGLSPNRVKERVGLCLGGTLVYHRLSGRENLEYFGKLYNVAKLDDRIDELASVLGLSANMDQMVETYSFGMKAKLALARSMIHSPDLLILDEPTLGIDFQLAVQIRKFIRDLKCTVLLTTHYMEEAEMLADDICIIDKGKMLDQGSKSQVMKKYGAATLAEAFTTAVDGQGNLRVAS